MTELKAAKTPEIALNSAINMEDAQVRILEMITVATDTMSNAAAAVGNS